VVAVLDSNSDPRKVKFPFPGNDDASRAINLYCDLAVAAVLDGIQAEMTASGIDVGEIEDLGEIEELPAPGGEEIPAPVEEAAAAQAG
jgi:small subunit ribosomal protein S2